MDTFKNYEGSKSFPIGESAQGKGLPYVPECHKVKITNSDRPGSSRANSNVPIIDFGGMSDPARRSSIVKEIMNACQSKQFFQVINHGIPQKVLDRALSTAFGFFDQPMEVKSKLMSNDVRKPVRYGTSIKDGQDKVQFWRMLLKQYAHPLKDWIRMWPDCPSDYREKMGEYAVAAQKLALEITGVITESLGLGPAYLTQKMHDGMQVMTINCYPACPNPEIALGLPPHSDYSCLSIVLQSSSGLEILDTEDGTWKAIPVIPGALQVHVGDYLEVLTNGKYKSISHRVTLNSDRARFSIASLHTFGMDETIETAEEFVDEEHPKGYKASSFKDFLDFISKNDLGDSITFLDTLKIRN